MIIKIYFKNKRKPFAEVEIDKESDFEELYNKIENSKKVVIFGTLIFDVNKFDYATLSNN